ncbi:MAG: GNAT family N-acetyltransferase [Nanoarchaeota archaeon]
MDDLYEIGKNTIELKVSSTEDFISIDELRYSIENPENIFLVAENNNKIIGFIYANSKDKDKPFKDKYACLVYLAVIPEFRRNYIAEKLYFECENRLKEVGINFIYGWANADSNPIIKLMKKYGFSEGHRYI